MKGILDILDKHVAEVTKKTRIDRELQLTRAYLRYLELGYSADDLCIYEWPVRFKYAEGALHYGQKFYLGLKDEPPSFDGDIP